MKTKIVLAVLSTVIIAESAALALPYLSHLQPNRAYYSRSNPQSISFPFSVFNRPVSNNTEHELNPTFGESWGVDVRSTLVAASNGAVTEAEMAIAPAATSESHAIPTLIVQERADGLLRVEYFAQSWPNTYGLVLYNSTGPGWTEGVNVTIHFRSFGPPSAVDPQIAPRPNGYVDVLVGDAVVMSDYPIAWANLSDLYLYGYPGSSYAGGAIQLSFYELSTG